MGRGPPSRCRNRVELLLVEDNPIHVRLIESLLAGAKSPSFQLQSVGSLAEARNRLSDSGIDMISST